MERENSLHLQWDESVKVFYIGEYQQWDELAKVFYIGADKENKLLVSLGIESEYNDCYGYYLSQYFPIGMLLAKCKTEGILVYIGRRNQSEKILL